MTAGEALARAMDEVQERAALECLTSGSAESILAALDAAGFVVVPKETTREMREAGIDQGTDAGGELSYGDAMAIWAAMLAARPR